MARRNICGFESGDLMEVATSTGTISVVVTNAVAPSVYTLRSNPTTTGVGSVDMRPFSTTGLQLSDNYSVADLYTAFDFFVATAPAANDEPICRWLDTASAGKGEVRLTNSRKLRPYDAAGVAMSAAGATVLSLSTWYRIEVRWGTGAAATWEIRIDGVVELTGTGAIGTVNHGRNTLGKHANRNSQTVDFFYDNVSIDDAAYPGETIVRRLALTGNGTHTAWTGDYTDVDEIPDDGDTSYITVSASGSKETFVKEALTNATIKCVKNHVIARSVASGAIRVLTKSGATESETISLGVGTSYTQLAKLHEVDPATSAAWTLAGLNAAEMGVNSLAAGALRCTSVAPMVEYEPVAAGGAAPGSLGLLGVGR